MLYKSPKLLSIVGPTATGKTALAIAEADKKPSIIISADSRQVYRGMNIVTGKDHPEGVTIYGLDIVEPDQPCSVAVWYDAVQPVITQAIGEGKQVIVVGGTGLYIRALTHGIATIQIPINHSLRTELAKLSVDELQSRLESLAPSKFASMNHSDQHNPRRLVRAIEIATSNVALCHCDTVSLVRSARFVGLRYSDNSQYVNKIRMRVLSRLRAGALEETRQLLLRYDKSLPSLTAIGYKSLIALLEGELTEQTMIDQWVHDELAYAKRQITWFNKQDITWYDIAKGEYASPKS